MESTDRVLTGIRPTGDLTIANYVGAMKPVIELQESFEGSINLFVADLHGLTDQEPELINRTRIDTLRSFIAAGVDPERVSIYLQSQIEEPTVVLANYLDRHVSFAELMRVPTLKEKLKKDQNEENATVALGRYPILMAADIFVQDATDVPVGQDQYPHIEFARKLSRRFNTEYGNGEQILVEPNILAVRALRIMSLDGVGKMSKSNSKGALLLKEDEKSIATKIGRAKTDVGGEINETLESHFTLCEELCTSPEQLAYLDGLKSKHLRGQTVMGDFKKFMIELTSNFLTQFQDRYDKVDEDEIQTILDEGGANAEAQADSVLNRTRKAMGLVS